MQPCRQCTRVSLIRVDSEPGRTCPRVQREPRLAHMGRYISPSCHRWTSLSPASPAEERTDARFQSLLIHFILNECNTAKPSYLFGDVTIFINVIEVKGPVELLSDRTSEQHRQADDKVLEADGAIPVDVKRVEEEVSIGGCIWVTRGGTKGSYVI